MVSYANLPQLTIDLLIHSIGLKRLGDLGDGSTVVPMVGQLDVHEDDKDPGQDATLTTGGVEGVL